jgi:hypothetical protein
MMPTREQLLLLPTVGSQEAGLIDWGGEEEAVARMKKARRGNNS